MNLALERPLSELYRDDIRAETQRLRAVDIDNIIARHGMAYTHRLPAEAKTSRKISE